MVLELLNKYQEELTADKIELNENLDFVCTKIKENKKVIEMLNQKNESYFNEFTPHKMNETNIQRLNEVTKENEQLNIKMNNLKNKIDSLNIRLQEVKQSINEINESNNFKKNEKELNKNIPKETSLFISEYKKEDFISDCNYLKKFIFIDQMRCNLIINKIIKNIK